MSAVTPRHGLPYLAAGQAQKHVTMNEALRRLDGLVQLTVQARGLAAAPDAPVDGQAWIAAADIGAGDWPEAVPGAVMRWIDGAWDRLEPQAGWIAHVRDEEQLIVHDGLAWRPLPAMIGTLQSLSLLGIGTAADSSHPLSVRGPGALFHPAEDENDVRLTLARPESEDVASVLFQTGWSGRAEIGCVGNDDLSIRLSPDGEAWRTAVTASTNDSEVRLFDHLVFGRSFGISYLNKLEASPLALGPAGGSTLETTPFWRGIHITAPPITVDDAPIYPRASAYFSYDGAADPEDFGFVLALGNLPEGLSADLRLAPAGEGSVVVEAPLRLASFSASGLPSAAAHGAGALIYLPDAADGSTLAWSDGTNWRRCDDGTLAV